MEEKIVPSYINGFHIFVLVFMVKSAQGATQMFTVYTYASELSGPTIFVPL